MFVEVTPQNQPPQTGCHYISFQVLYIRECLLLRIVANIVQASTLILKGSIMIGDTKKSIVAGTMIVDQKGLILIGLIATTDLTKVLIWETVMRKDSKMIKIATLRRDRRVLNLGLIGP